MPLISNSLALTSQRLSSILGYLSAVAGLAYFGVSRFAFDKEKAENLVWTTPRPLVGMPLMWLGLGCIVAGMLSLICFGLARYGAETPATSSSTQARVRFLCWLPMLAALGLMLRDVLH